MPSGKLQKMFDEAVSRLCRYCGAEHGIAPELLAEWKELGLKYVGCLECEAEDGVPVE